jgi:hypothetical protein
LPSIGVRQRQLLIREQPKAPGRPPPRIIGTQNSPQPKIEVARVGDPTIH